jgi:AcrR family transcriptional regulator
MRITKEAVIQTAADMADKDGLNNLSLKAIAEKLNIRTPSLYNHITSLDDLLREVAHKGMRTMNEQMTQAAIGTLGDAAIKSICIAYFKFMIAHPGVYETIQWVTWHGNRETAEIFDHYKALLIKIIHSCNLKKEKTDEILDLLIGVLHGYATMQLGQAIATSEETIKGLLEAIDTVLLGIHQKYNG